MKKFRIVQTGEGFIIQYKSFFRWHNYEECYIDYDKRHDWWEISDYLSDAIKYKTLDDAKYNLSVIKSFPIRYKKHKIDIAKDYLNNGIVYVDISILCGSEYFRLADKDLDVLKEKIDKYEENKFQHELDLKRKKEDKKVIKVYKV